MVVEFDIAVFLISTIMLFVSVLRGKLRSEESVERNKQE